MLFGTSWAENITVNQPTGGTVSYEDWNFNGQDTVRLHNTPNDGYRFVSYIVKTPSGNDITVSTFGPDLVTGETSYYFVKQDATITAEFERSAYSITVTNPAGGTVTASLSSASEGDKVNLSYTVNSGYIFRRFIVRKTSDNSEVSVINGSAMTGQEAWYFNMPGSNVTVTAEFAPAHAITVSNPENGSITAPASAAAGDTVQFSVGANSGYEVKDCTVTKTGDSGVSVSTSIIFNDPNGKVYSFTMPDYPVTVSARTELKVCPITWNTADCTVDGPTAGYAGDEITFTVTPSDGYRVRTISVNGEKVYGIVRTAVSGNVYTYKMTLYVDEGNNNSYIYIFTMPGHDVNVSAVFAILYKITYELDGGRFEGVRYLSYLASTETFTLTQPTRDGYTFTGWTGSNGTTPQTSVTIPKGSTGDMSYTATWTANTYTVKFNANGGTGDDATQEYTYDTAQAMTANAFTREGYTFSGWNTESDGTGTGYTDGQEVSNIATGGEVTLYAQWTATEYTITYELDGGTVETANPAKYTVETTTFTLTNPTKDGYIFTGWTGTGLDGAAMSVTIAKGSTGNREYTATWTGGGSDPEGDVPVFKTYQMKLEGRIEVIFYAEIPEKFRNSDTVMIFDVSGDKSNNNPREFNENFKNDSGSYYGFKCEITSVQMADTITATLSYKDGGETKSTVLKCRAKDYLDYGIEHETDETTLALLKAIKDYGHYVQPCLATENNWTVGKEHAEMDLATEETTFDGYISEAQSDVSSYSAEIGTNTAGIAVTYLLDLRTDTEIYVYVSPASSVSGVYLDGSEISVIKDGRYEVNIAGISAPFLGKAYTVTVKYGNNEQFDIKVSAMSYVNTVLKNSTDTATRRAVTSLYRYYRATQAYMEAHS